MAGRYGRAQTARVVLGRPVQGWLAGSVVVHDAVPCRRSLEGRGDLFALDPSSLTRS
jgi:hypothetical protein